MYRTKSYLEDTPDSSASSRPSGTSQTAPFSQLSMCIPSTPTLRGWTWWRLWGRPWRPGKTRWCPPSSSWTFLTLSSSTMCLSLTASCICSWSGQQWAPGLRQISPIFLWLCWYWHHWGRKEVISGWCQPSGVLQAIPGWQLHGLARVTIRAAQLPS